MYLWLVVLKVCRLCMQEEVHGAQVVLAQEHGNNEGRDCEEEADYVSRYNCVLDCTKFSWIWLFGFGLFCLGNVCDFVALGITSLSAVTLLGSWSLVVNPMAAYFLLHEVLAAFDIASIALIIAGIVFTVISADHTPNDWALQRLIALIDVAFITS